MGRVAVFVDAGYLFAQGSAALGGKQVRANLRLNETAAFAELKDVCTAKAAACDLLRVYWYDGVHNFKGPSLEQERLANTDNVKIRLGFINSVGEQKGVDSLIVTDLIDLARNQAITDAILLSGDEDVRIGVQIAQQFGVRVHLVGIGPGNQSQAKTLKQEADTITVWDKDVVSKFLTISLPKLPPSQTAPQATITPQVGGVKSALTAEVEKTIREFAGALDATEIAGLKRHWETSAGIPPEYDGRLLARSRSILGRDLTTPEKALARSSFKTAIKDAP